MGKNIDIGKIGRTLVMAVIAFAMLYPFLWMFVASLTPERNIFAFPFSLIPNPINWNGYKSIWINSPMNLPFSHFFWNSVKVTFMAVTGALISCSLAGYGFAKIEFPGRNVLFLMLLATMMIPGQVVMLPNYMIFKELGLTNTHPALWVKTFFASAFGVFLFRQFFSTIPNELNEAAEMDGASHFTIFVRIIVPLAKPVFATMLIINFMGYWNNYEDALIYLRTTSLFTLPMALKVMSNDEYIIQYAGIMAGSVCAALPVLIVFVAAQKYFIQGIAVTGLKG